MIFLCVGRLSAISTSTNAMTGRASANTGSLEVTIEARVVQGSSGARDTYPIVTLTLIDPVQAHQILFRQRPRHGSKQRQRENQRLKPGRKQMSP